MVVPTDVVLAENDEAIGLVGVVGLVEGVGVDAHVAIGVGGVVVVVVETVVVVVIVVVEAVEVVAAVVVAAVGEGSDIERVGVFLVGSEKSFDVVSVGVVIVGGVA